MSINQAEILAATISDLIEENVLNDDAYLQLEELVSQLADLADPQADKLRSAERECESLQQENAELKAMLNELRNRQGKMEK